MPDPNSIRIKRSNTTTNTPSSLLNGELASNISDQKLWIGNSSNTPILLSDITNTFVNQGAWDYYAAYNKNAVVTYAGIFYYSISAVPPYNTSPNINTTYWAILSDPSGSSGSYLPLAGGAMTGSITSVGTTHDTEVAGDFFGVQLSADTSQGTMLNFDGLDTYDGANHMLVNPTGLIFPDSTTQTTAYTDTTARNSISSTATGLTYTSATGVFSLTASYAIPTTTSTTNWDSAYTQRLQWDGGSTNLVAATGRTSLGATTIGSNLFTLPSPADIAFIRINLNNTVSTLSASTFRTAIGATTVGANMFALTNPSAITFPRFNADNTVSALDAATFKTSLSLVIGTNVQAWDADLDAIAAIAGTTGLLKKTAANTWSLDTSTYLTANQTITLSGDVSGSGTTAITTTLATVPITKGGTGQTTANAGLNALLPSQTSNSGKYLTTNGTNTSWGAVTGGPSFTASATAPASPVAGDRWYDTNTGSYLIYLNDGTSSQWVETSNSGMVSNPTGTIIPFAGATAPSGFLLCNGATVSSSDYLALHSVISNTYGGSAYTGAAGLNFTLPDYRGRVLIGAGTGSGLTTRTLGGTVGAESHTVSSSNISQFSTGNAGSHTHSFSKEVLTYVGSGGNRYDPYPGSVWAGHIAAGLTLDTKPDHTHTVGTASPTAISNLQPSIGVNYLIKT